MEAWLDMVEKMMIYDEPLSKAVCKVPAVQDERVLAGLDKVGSNLNTVSTTGHPFTNPQSTPDPNQASHCPQSRMAARPWSTESPCRTTPQSTIAHALPASLTHLVIRMQSPKTGMKSADTWDIEGCALA